MRTHRFVTLAAFGVCLAAHWFAPESASALSCRNRLVLVGDSAVHVRSVCGEPVQITSRTESRTQAVYAPGINGALVGNSITVTVQVDVWVYDFGRTRFMEEITFESGVVRSMRSLGYGTGSGHSPG